MKSIITLAFACLLFPLSFQAQMRPDSIPGKRVLIEDLYALKSAILGAHPDPYAFCTKQEFNAAFGKAIESVTDKTTFTEFVFITAGVLGTLRDSHTSIDYSFLGKMQTENNRGIIPVRIHSVKGQVYVDLDRDSILPAGAHILCIHNVDASKFYLDALKLSATEGDAVSGHRRVADALFPYAVGLSSDLPDTVKIDFQRFGSDETETTLFPIYKKERWAERQKKLQKGGDGELFQLSYHAGDSIAVLKIGTFAASHTGQFYKFVKKSFKEINEKKVSMLAIDLRDNGGGRANNVEYLYSFLESKGHNTPSNIIGKSSEIARNRSKWARRKVVRWYLRTFRKKDEDIRGFLRLYEAPDGHMDTVYFDQKVIQKSKCVYTGNAALFINGMSASASVDFTNTFYTQKRGEVIGEPCLGPHTGTFGNPAPYEMPKTKLPVIIATIRYNYDNTFRYDRLPIKPHVLLEVTPQDLAENRDPYLDYLIQSLRKK